MSPWNWKNLCLRLGPVILGAALIIAIRVNAGTGKDAFRNTGPRKVEITETPQFRFEERGLAAGLTAVHTRNEVAPELANLAPFLGARGASVSVADFNNDNLMDFYYTSAGEGTKNALYRNNGDGTFTDVAGELGVADVNRGRNSMSALWLDYDNDGWKDLYLVAMGCNRLFRNQEGKRFIDVTERAGDIGGKPDLRGFCASPRSVLGFDYNLDGHLDIFVSNMNPKDWRKVYNNDTAVLHRSSVLDPNGPQAYLMRNNGNGTFSEVAVPMGVGNYQWAQSAGAGDFNNDGWPDLFVANDVTIDTVYMNKGGEKGFEARPDYLPGLFPRYGMNGDVADMDDDGWVDIFNTKLTKTAFTSGLNQLWINLKGQRFENRAEWHGVARCGWGWAARFVDLESRGKKDLVVVNGLVSGNPDKSYWFFAASLGAMDSYFLQQAKFYPPMKDMDYSGNEKNCVFFRGANHEFADVADQVGVTDAWDGRGMAIIDAENDGRPDFLIGNVGKRALFYHNKPAHNNEWIGFHLVGTKSNRDAVGARVKVVHRRKDGQEQTQYWEVNAGNGYASQADPRLLFGLGPDPVKILSATVSWPGQGEQVLDVSKLKTRSYNRVVESR